MSERFTELPTTGAAQLTDIICAVQGYTSPSSLGLSVQETLQQVFNLFATNIILSHSGNPNGNTAGTTYQLLWDTTDNFLWICTTSGSSSTAVWKPVIGALTNGQLAIGSTGNAPVQATLTGGAGISIVNGAGSITISGSGGGVSWTDVTGSTQTLVANNGYIADRGAGNVTFSLPASSTIGDTIHIVGRQNGWSVTQGAGQQIILGTSSSTVGAGGSIASTHAQDCITMTATQTNTEWTVRSILGILTVV